jgi:hypothetical protein
MRESFGNNMNDPALGVTPIENGAGPPNNLYSIHQVWIDSAQVLIRPVAKGGVVESNAIDQNENLIAHQSPHNRGTVSVSRLLYHQTRFLAEYLRGGPWDSFLYLLTGCYRYGFLDIIHFFLDSGGRHRYFIERYDGDLQCKIHLN